MTTIDTEQDVGRFPEPDLVQDLALVAGHGAILVVTAEPDHADHAETSLVRAASAGEHPPIWLRPAAPVTRTVLLQALADTLAGDLPNLPFGHPGGVEAQVSLALRAGRRPLIVPAAHTLDVVALLTLFALWKVPAPGGWPLILAGDRTRLKRLLARPRLESLRSHVFTYHHL
ncbi:hypothetical protein ACN20G_37115 (plasmid) [Streptomyces sp. BI20]|uniref:hypothetical protein n=1 Tax=Streptomyces sp. BI20 TaxID=3403460 RepID=UPI003C730227